MEEAAGCTHSGNQICYSCLCLKFPEELFWEISLVQVPSNTQLPTSLTKEKRTGVLLYFQKPSYFEGDIVQTVILSRRKLLRRNDSLRLSSWSLDLRAEIRIRRGFSFNTCICSLLLWVKENCRRCYFPWHTQLFTRIVWLNVPKALFHITTAKVPVVISKMPEASRLFMEHLREHSRRSTEVF